MVKETGQFPSFLNPKLEAAPLFSACFQGRGLLGTMPPLPQTYVLPSLKSLPILRASVSEETGFPSGHRRLNLSFPKPSLAQPLATIMGRGRAGSFYQALLYLGSLGLIFLLGILYCLQVVSGTVIVHEFPAPFGNSFLTQSQERGP